MEMHTDNKEMIAKKKTKQTKKKQPTLKTLNAGKNGPSNS